MIQHHAIARMAAGLREQRVALGVPQEQLAFLSDHCRTSIVKLEAGRPIDPRIVLDLAGVLTLLELYGELPPPTERELTADLMPLFAMEGARP